MSSSKWTLLSVALHSQVLSLKKIPSDLVTVEMQMYAIAALKFRSLKNAMHVCCA